MTWDLSPILNNTATSIPVVTEPATSSVSVPTTKTSTTKTNSAWEGQSDWDAFFNSDPGTTVDNWAGGSITLNNDGSASYYNDNIVGGVQNFTSNADIRELAGMYPEVYMQYANAYGSDWADGFTPDNSDLAYFNPLTGMECDVYGCGASSTQGTVEGAPSLMDLLAESPLSGGSSSGATTSNYSTSSSVPTATTTADTTGATTKPNTSNYSDGSITFPTIDNHALLNNAMPVWIDQFSQGIDNYFDAYGNLVDLPNQIDEWTQNAVNRQRVTGEDIANVLSAVANQRNAQGIMGGTESDNLGATTISNLGKIITENQNNLLSNANNLKASAISAQPGQAQYAINDLLSLYGTSAQESASWGQMAMNLLMNNF